MTDEELIARLRQHDGWVTLEAHTHLTAADRIAALTEQLSAARKDAEEAEAYAGELEADRRKTYEALLKVSRIHDEVEAKLAKAVEALENLADCVDLGCFCSEMQMATAMDIARATLAEIKGESHD